MRSYARDRRPMPYGTRNALGGFLDERPPLHLHAVGGCRERKRGHERAGIVADPGGHAAHAELGFLVVGRPALALDALQLALELGQRGKRVPGVRRETRALRVVAQAREAFLEEKELAGGGDVQR